MTLHDHDPDLIMALAEGTLEAGARPAAERAVADCDECRADLELQRTALAALAAVSHAPLTDLEARRLHRALDAQLGHERAAATVARPQARKRNWAPIISIAAIFLALVLVSPTLRLIGGGDDSADDMFAAIQDADAGGDDVGSQTTTAAAEQQPLAEAAPDAGLEGTDGGGAPVETAAADTTAADITAADELGLDRLGTTLEPLGDLTVDSWLDEEAAREAAAALPELEFAPASPADDECVAEGRAYAGEPVAYTLGSVVLAGTDQQMVVTVHVGQTDDVVLVVHDPETCVVLGATP